MNGSYEPHTYERGCQGNERLVDLAARVRPDAKLAKAMQPGLRPLDHPTVDAQAAARLRPPAGDLGIDAPRLQFLPVRARVKGPVGVQLVRSAPRGPDLPRHRRRGAHQ